VIQSRGSGDLGARITSARDRGDKGGLEEALTYGGDEGMRTMCGSRTGGWSLPGVMSD
jgi:hypothetical protein